MEIINKKKATGVFFVILSIFLVVVFVCYWVSETQLEAVMKTSESVSPKTGVFNRDEVLVLEQVFFPETDTLDEIKLLISSYGEQTERSVSISILENGSCLWEKEFISDFPTEKTMCSFPIMPQLTEVKMKQLLLRIVINETIPEERAILYYGDSIQLARGYVEKEIRNPLIVNGTAIDGMLCFETVGRNLLPLKKVYWILSVSLAICFSFFYWHGYFRWRQGRKSLFGSVVNALRYKFLLKQLVGRDFKTRYKRSFLGVFWSVLNPLLTMLVQYIVFSSLFKTSIPNFVVYLMCGGILFSFFSEAVTLGLSSIVVNASLINKVYAPKSIYPISRVLSSSLNCLFSLIPLFLIVLISGVPIRKSILLLPILLLNVLLFVIGVSLIMSSMMVFFRDTQFLWSVLVTFWMYMTPIFYPESIIPTQFIRIYRLNPMYQFIYFFREIILNGNAPGPLTFLACLLCAVIPLSIGIFVFKKTQDRFVLYL